MTQPTFDAAYNARVLAVLNNAMARLYILPWLRHADLEDYHARHQSILAQHAPHLLQGVDD